MSSGPGPFHIRTLYESRIISDTARLEVYNTILKRIYSEIELTIKTDPNQHYFMYVIQDFIPGLPFYDAKDVAEYIILRLNASGFDVTYTPPNFLVISWQAFEQQYNKTLNPFTLTLSSIVTIPAPTVQSAAAVMKQTPPKPVDENKPKRRPAAKRVEDYVPSKSFFI